ncbi:putative transcriptional regulator [Chitinophaga skermanii]|uniref:Putative transcriptional regulator n=1 Tax=Chitinophaga skermanii TaxID=331697 RepID=A0A327RA93_9BACT|nr:YqgE/AlgH family protein [Chitinophaga skermanii]RAJ10827.1 putative transcriptional regulator [Chitinophaga skermanii]
MAILSPGTMLIADPFLKDPNFARSVILVCEHTEADGTFGFVVNNLCPVTLAEVVPNIQHPNVPLYVGGPVKYDTLHFIHQLPGIIDGGVDLGNGMYWGGDYEKVVEYLNVGLLDLDLVKFFVGYSGWDQNQLEEEIKEGSWLATKVQDPSLLFSHDAQNIWQNALKKIEDPVIQLMANFPIDPSLN